MGLSYGLSEAFVPGQTRTLKDYRLASAMHAPEQVDIVAVEVPANGWPFGAKGIAEMTASAGITSASNAIAGAIRARCYQAPCRPEVIWAVLGAVMMPHGSPPFLSSQKYGGRRDRPSQPLKAAQPNRILQIVLRIAYGRSLSLGVRIRC
jgi:hypothetical protein